jgi:hypothetical protein
VNIQKYAHIRDVEVRACKHTYKSMDMCKKVCTYVQKYIYVYIIRYVNIRYARIYMYI